MHFRTGVHLFPHFLPRCVHQLGRLVLSIRRNLEKWVVSAHHREPRYSYIQKSGWTLGCSGTCLCATTRRHNVPVCKAWVTPPKRGCKVQVFSRLLCPAKKTKTTHCESHGTGHTVAQGVLKTLFCCSVEGKAVVGLLFSDFLQCAPQQGISWYDMCVVGSLD